MPNRTTVSKTKKHKKRRWGTGSLALVFYLYTTTVLRDSIGIITFLKRFYPDRKVETLSWIHHTILSYLKQLQAKKLVKYEKLEQSNAKVWRLTKPIQSIYDITDLLSAQLRFSPILKPGEHPPQKSRLYPWRLPWLLQRHTKDLYKWISILKPSNY